MRYHNNFFAILKLYFWSIHMAKTLILTISFGFKLNSNLKNTSRHWRSAYSLGASSCRHANTIHYRAHMYPWRERDLLAWPERMGGLGLINPSQVATLEYEASVKVTKPLVQQIVSQQQTLPDLAERRTLQHSKRKEKDDCLNEKLEEVKRSLPAKTNRAVEFAVEKGASS